MKCSCGGEFVVRQTYYAGPTSKTQRLQCDRCGIIATGVTVIKNVDPPNGQGAYSLANRMKRQTQRNR